MTDPDEQSSGPGAAVRLEVIEEAAAPPACTARDREQFRRVTLPALREEFGDQLLVEYLAADAGAVTFLPRVSIQDEALECFGFPSHCILRLVVGRHLALERMVEALALEAEAEAGVQGVEAGCWQDALLLLSCRRDDSDSIGSPG